MGYLPVLMNMTGQPVLVVGGGRAAEIKVRACLEADARVTVVSPRLTSLLNAWQQAGRVHWIAEAFSVEHLTPDYRLVVAATDDPHVNALVCQRAQDLDRMVADAGDPDNGGVLFPAGLRRPTFLVAVTSFGRAPLAASYLRDYLDGMLGPEWDVLMTIMQECRQAVKARVPPGKRRAVLKGLGDMDLLGKIKAGDETGARAEALAYINRWQEDDG